VDVYTIGFNISPICGELIIPAEYFSYQMDCKLPCMHSRDPISNVREPLVD